MFYRGFRRGGQQTPNFGQRFGGNYYPSRGEGPRPDAARSQNFYQEEDNIYDDHRQNKVNQPEVLTGIDGGEPEEEYFMEAFEEEQELCDEFNALMEVGYTFDDVPMERDQRVRRNRYGGNDEEEYLEGDIEDEDGWDRYS